MKKPKKITEAERRKRLADNLSESKITELADRMRKARAALEARVSGETEMDVLWLRRDLGNLMELLDEFDDTRTEI